METYWVPAVNHLGTFGRLALAQLTEVYRIESDFEAKVAQAFEALLDEFAPEVAATVSAR